jgi:hypothetical protein
VTAAPVVFIWTFPAPPVRSACCDRLAAPADTCLFHATSPCRGDSTRRLTRRNDEGHTFRLALRQQSSANYAGLTIFVGSKYFKPKYDKIFCIVNAASQQG